MRKRVFAPAVFAAAVLATACDDGKVWVRGERVLGFADVYTWESDPTPAQRQAEADRGGLWDTPEGESPDNRPVCGPEDDPVWIECRPDDDEIAAGLARYRAETAARNPRGNHVGTDCAPGMKPDYCERMGYG